MLRAATAGLIVTLVAAIPIQAQSLAEVAKKEKERRKALHDTPSHVITDEDLRGGRPASKTQSSKKDEAASHAKPSQHASASESSAPTETDLHRQRAISELKTRFRQMVGAANELIATAQRYTHTDCTVGTGQPRFPECSAMEQRIGVLACAVGTSLDEVQEIARKGSLPPGIVRDAREATGLDADIWNDLQRLSREHCKGS